MARREARPRAERERVLRTVHRCCPDCGRRMRDPLRQPPHGDDARRAGAPAPEDPAVREPGCARHHRPYRPEAEGGLALPQHEFGLDVIASTGALRYREHRSVPEIHAPCGSAAWRSAERTVTNLLDRYDELAGRPRWPTTSRLRAALAGQGRVDPGARRAAAGRRPRGPVGRARLPVGRGPARRSLLLLDGRGDLAGLLREVAAAVGVPVAGVVSDGQHSVRKAVAAGPARRAAPAVPVPLPARGGACRSSRPTATPRRS